MRNPSIRHAEGRGASPRLLLPWGAALAVALFLVLAPGTAPAVRWTDALGRSVEVPAAPRRIVSLVPSVTEVLFAVGLGERVAGVTRFCDYPPEARGKPQVGGYSDPSVEALVGLRPDLVFAAADSTPRALVQRLEGLGVAVYVIYPKDVASAVAAVGEVARVAGAPGPGEALAARLEASVTRVAAAVAGRPRPRVVLGVMLKPLVVVAPGTLGDDLIRLAGGTNAVPKGSAPYPTWGPEALLAADPEVVIVTPHPGEPDPTGAVKAWPELRAVRSGRVVSVEADWVHRPGPRLVQGLEALARALHPGLP